jgi:hypothetical protein
LDGELDSERTESLEAHLSSCSLCQRELELQQAVKLLVQERLSNIVAPGSLKKRVILELGRAEEYRESGIQVLDLVRWGTHIAQFYNTKGDVTEVLVPYMRNGLEDNELCVWVTAEISEGEAREALVREIPSLQKHIDKRQLQLFSYRDWYLSGGYLDIGGVLNNALNRCHEALSNGYSGLRVAGNTSWLEQSDWDSFMEFESLLDSAVSDHKALVLCVYKEAKCTTNGIVDVMDRHKYVISRIDDTWKLRRSAEIV